MVGCVGGDIRCRDVFGQIAICGGEVPSVFRDDAFDGPSLSKLFQLGAADSRIPETAGAVLERELHHALGAHIGKRVDQDAIDHAEYRGRGADAECQREDRSERKPGATLQFARGVAQVDEE